MSSRREDESLVQSDGDSPRQPQNAQRRRAQDEDDGRSPSRSHSRSRSRSSSSSSYDPDGEPELSPQRPRTPVQKRKRGPNVSAPTAKAKSKNASNQNAANQALQQQMAAAAAAAAAAGGMPMPASPANFALPQGFNPMAFHQAAAAAAAAGYVMPAIGPGGMPIMLPTGQNVANGQTPASASTPGASGSASTPANASTPGGVPVIDRQNVYHMLRGLPLPPGGVPGGMPFPFPMHPGLLAPAGIAQADPNSGAHDGEGSSGERNRSRAGGSPPRMGTMSPSRGMSSTPGGSRAEPGTQEWARQRKDNHKEVERRRRGNINEGINALARIIPNGQGGDKAKGAVLSRAVAYVQQLKEGEQKVMERWTMEKLIHEKEIGELRARVNHLEGRERELGREVHRLRQQLGLPTGNTGGRQEPIAVADEEDLDEDEQLDEDVLPGQQDEEDELVEEEDEEEHRPPKRIRVS